MGTGSRATDKRQQNLPISRGERRGDDGGVGCAGVAIKGDRAGVGGGEKGRTDGDEAQRPVTSKPTDWARGLTGV